MTDKGWTTLWQLADLYVEDRGDGSARIRRGDWSEWVILDQGDIHWLIGRLNEVVRP